MAHTRTVDPELLLAEARSMRAIARKLVVDEALADDVLQDTWVAALEGAPAGDGRGGLRAWLAAVVRNLALRRRRREALRVVAERAAARAERDERSDGGTELERVQLQRTLVDALLVLDEPYRSAVVLRHLDGLSAAEIARRQGCSVVAARQRVSRGLVELRAILARHGERPDACLALAPLLVRPAHFGALAGAAVVNAKVTLGAIGVVLAALGLWLARGGGHERGGEAPVAATSGAQIGEAANGALAEPAAELTVPANAGSRPVDARPAREERSAAPAPDSPGAKAMLRGRITDTRGAPIDGAKVVIPDLELGLDPVSESDGAIEAKLELPLDAARASWPVRVSCEGYVARSLELDLHQSFTIALQALPVIAGRVLDPGGDRVAPPGYVQAEIIDAVTRERRDARTDLAEDGTYRLEALPLGRLVALEARARGYATRKLPLDLALEPDGTSELDVALARGATVTGTVLDARTRAPIPGATVWMEAFRPEEGSVHPLTKADEQGRFRIEGADEEVQHGGDMDTVFFWLLAEAAGYAASPTRGYGAQASDGHVYDFEMLLEPAGCALRVEVVFDDGRPASGATVWAIDAQSNPHFDSADENGVHEFTDLPPGPLGLLLACDTRIESANLSGVHLKTGRHELRAELELTPGARTERYVLRPPGRANLAGRIVDVHGSGVPDFAVRSHQEFMVYNLSLASGWDEVRTDADGRYEFAGLHPGRYQVWTNGEGTTMACAQPGNAYVELGLDEAAAVPDLVVGACFTLEGRVDGGAVPLTQLELSARDPANGAALASTRPDADGSFRFEPLVAREYDLVLLHGETVLDRTVASPTNASGLFLRAR